MSSLPRTPISLPVWLTEQVSRATVGDLSVFDFGDSEEWQRYLRDHVPPTPELVAELVVMDDVDDYSFDVAVTARGHVEARAVVPGEWFVGLNADTARPVYRRIVTRLMRDLARNQRWPEPPGEPDEAELPAHVHQRELFSIGWDFVVATDDVDSPDFVDVDSASWFVQDDDWQTYLREIGWGERFDMDLVVSDTDVARRRISRADGLLYVRLTVPRHLVIADDGSVVDEVLVRHGVEAMHWFAERYGLPEPPPMPMAPRAE